MCERRVCVVHVVVDKSEVISDVKVLLPVVLPDLKSFGSSHISELQCKLQPRKTPLRSCLVGQISTLGKVAFRKLGCTTWALAPAQELSLWWAERQ